MSDNQADQKTGNAGIPVRYNEVQFQDLVSKEAEQGEVPILVKQLSREILVSKEDAVPVDPEDMCYMTGHLSIIKITRNPDSNSRSGTSPHKLAEEPEKMLVNKESKKEDINLSERAVAMGIQPAKLSDLAEDRLRKETLKTQTMTVTKKEDKTSLIVFELSHNLADS